MQHASTVPGYVGLAHAGALGARAAAAQELLDPCRLCPRECRARRRQGKVGTCGVAGTALVSSAGPHFGEERPLVGRRGSGTIFLAGCNLGCIFCQNAEISHGRQGSPASPERLAQTMLALQDMGCHNINLVTPTHQVPQILAALAVAAGRGLRLPLVYNCGGYESVETLELLEGVIDIYMPDFKYWEAPVGRELSGVPDYPDVARAAVREMHRQVGDLVVDGRGVARRGLLVRHLVLPAGLAGTERVMRFLADLSPDTYVNVMSQYHPRHLAARHPDLSRGVSRQEVAAGVAAARSAGLHRLDGYV
ncbi:MAG: radical SAM protein [Candidatus Methylomirabilales bacterium]